MKRSWKQVALRLGSCMEAHAFCDSHRTYEEGCPFCDDRAAYAEFRARLGQDGHVEPAVEPITTVPIWDLKAQAESDHDAAAIMGRLLDATEDG